MPNDCIKTGIINFLWKEYLPSIPYYKSLFQNKKPVLDHLAIIDLPNSPNSGISFLKSIFDRMGFEQGGGGYLPEKYNDFIWMTDPNCHSAKAIETLPQVVLADFRLESFSPKAQNIISKYIESSKPFNFSKFDEHLEQNQIKQASQYLQKYLSERAWDTPTTDDYTAIKEENQLLAWVLLFGRKANHFGVNITFEPYFSSLVEYNNHIRTLNFAELNSIKGEIKGGEHDGIAQSSTVGKKIQVQTADGLIDTHDSFMEFVWRYSKKDNPIMWNDYFTGFVAHNANHVIESLYDTSKNIFSK